MEARSNRFLDPGAVPLKGKTEGNIWARLVSLTKWLLLAASGVLMLVWFVPVYRSAENLKASIEQHKQIIAQEQEENRRLNQQLELLRTNTSYVERIARDKLNLGKPGEMIFRFDPYPPSTPVQPSSANTQNP